MAKVLAVGIATLDIVNTVEHYPHEDSEIRASHQRQSRGGNATNTLCVLSQLSHDSHWAGVIVDDSDGQTILADLNHYQINTKACVEVTSGKMPTSYITQCRESGSRTIVHFRDCPEFSYDDFLKVDLAKFDWIHFEGRNIEQTELMLQYLKQHLPSLPCSLEVEKPREKIERLFPLADWLFFSKVYANHQGFSEPAKFLSQLSALRQGATCTWAEQGAWSIDGRQQLHHQPADTDKPVVDTLGAGDTFNAGFIHGQIQKWNTPRTLAFATQLASHKCTQSGFSDILRHFPAADQHCNLPSS